MNDFTTCLPTTNEELRHRLYSGELFLIPRTPESLQLVEGAFQDVQAALEDCSDPREAQFSLTSDEFFQRAGALRKRFYTDHRFHFLVADLIQSLGFAESGTGFDPARLRVVSHDGHLNPAAAAMYHGHRDTWYANPQSMITWWIPLHDVCVDETFDFFPDAFETAVENDSEIFNFDRWVEDGPERLIGWQKKETGLTAKYPRLLQEPFGRRVSVECQRGDLLLFAGQHLHQTRRQSTGRTRFSVDFRTVDLNDHSEGIGATNVDNRSTGSWLKKFNAVQDSLDQLQG